MAQVLKTGTFAMADLLAARFQSAAEFGLNNIAEVLAADIAVHNTLVSGMMTDLVDVTTDRQRIAGNSVSGRMVKADEFTRAPTQKDAPGMTVGFPLEKFQFALGWTNDWLKSHTPADMAIKNATSQRAHLLQLRREIQRAIFTNTNRTFSDFTVDNVDLSVKAFLNADSSAIPEGPNGETFNGATHTHYTAAAALVAADVTAAVNTVLEHGFNQNLRIHIAAANETAFRALSGFTAYTDARLTLGTPTTLQPSQRLDYRQMDNRAIGIFGAAEVWVKPWMIANYLYVTDVGAPAKSLVMREPVRGARGLYIAAELDTFPLHAQYMEAVFGFGVWSRANGAVHYFAGGAYVIPTIEE